MKDICIQELRQLEQDILDFIVDVCQKNAITYFLCGGTLLGAYRHKGFIPWDDDIDVMMPRPDYERFLELFPRHEYLELRNCRNDKEYPLAFSTVNDARTVKVEKKLRKKLRNKLSVNIDVFPIDGLPDDVNECKNYYRQIATTQKLLECSTKAFGKAPTLKATIMKNAGIAVYRMLEFLGLRNISHYVSRMEKVAMKYNYEQAHYVGITAISHYGTKERNLKNQYEPSLKVTFEGKQYNSPKCYDTYLSQLYGKSYMKLPPSAQQHTHHTSNCYWKNKQEGGCLSSSDE